MLWYATYLLFTSILAASCKWGKIIFGSSATHKAIVAFKLTKS